jgi:hypothetical protein
MKIIKKLSLKNPNQEKLLLREIDVLKQIVFNIIQTL